LNRHGTRDEGKNVLLPGIIVLNYKYFPESPHDAPKVGDTAFAMSAIRVLKECNAFCGMILYERDEKAHIPCIKLDFRNSILCTTLTFNIRMDARLLRNAILAASQLLSAGFGTTPMLYYQTETLLGFHPDHLPICVTHHGPFYDDFARHFSEELAVMAFGGTVTKARLMQVKQETGIKQLRNQQNAFVLQHSLLQGRHLRKSGFEPKKIFSVSPPICSILATNDFEIGSSVVDELISSSGRILLFTAVARLDRFKNVELLLDVAIALLSHGCPIELLIAGDDIQNGTRRQHLLSQVPTRFLQRTKIIPKLPKKELYVLFASAKQTGIFVCPSRYETLGITPLEAALSGVTTIISDSRLVEASRYFPKKYRFKPTAEALVERIEEFIEVRAGMEACGSELRSHVETMISDEAFREDFLNAWMECSRLVGA
jgi:glycosyltransferase involved in cell wall biosynthesis